MRFFCASLSLVVAVAAHADVGPRRPAPVKSSALEQAEKLIGDNKLDEALAQLDKAPPQELRRFLLRAEVFRLKKDYDKAQDELAKALVLQPTLAQVRAERGAMLLELGRKEDAAAELRRAVTDKPELEDEWYNLGQVELQLGRCKEAVSAFETATARKPRDASNWIERARAELKCDKGEAALASARRATQLPDATADTFVLLGFAAEKVKKLDDAVNAYKRAQVLDEKAAKAFWAHGLLELNRSQPAAAVAPLEKAVALDPVGPKLTDLGRAKAALGKMDDAEKLFEQAVQKSPKYAAARLLLGQIYVQKKRCPDLTKLLSPFAADGQHRPAADKLRADCKAR